MKSSFLITVTIAAALWAAAAAQADVIFDSFGPGDAYNTIPSPQADYETDWAGTGSLYNLDVATRFGPLATTEYLTSVDLPISTAGPTDTAYIYLMSGSPEPTALVDYAVYAGLPAHTGSYVAPVSVPFDSYELVPGETYWIVLSTVDVDDSEIHWGTNPLGMTGGYGAYLEVNLAGSWAMYQGATPAMRVHVAPEAVANSAAAWGSVKALFR